MKILAMVIILLSLTGCANTKSEFVIDGSSEESTQKSLSVIEIKLDKKERKQLIVALLAINLSDVKSGYDFLGDVIHKGKGKGKGIGFSGIGKKIDGLNYYQILELASKSPTKVSYE
ncbi:MAG: hypothetical protein HRT53_16610 [Colwellia sp.]|nr:hypothetical protein [Colwellia sp.]